MAVSIRLRREGTCNCPYYKIVVANRRDPRDGRFIEIVGRYNPGSRGGDFSVALDRVEYWLKVGAQPSQTVNSLINKARKQQTQAAVA